MTCYFSGCPLNGHQVSWGVKSHRKRHKDAIADFARKSIPNDSVLGRKLKEDDVKYLSTKKLRDFATSRGIVIGAETTAQDIRRVLLETQSDTTSARMKEMNRAAKKLRLAGSPEDVADALLNMYRRNTTSSAAHRVRDFNLFIIRTPKNVLYIA